jgi:hypothetical protein
MITQQGFTQFIPGLKLYFGLNLQKPVYQICYVHIKKQV